MTDSAEWDDLRLSDVPGLEGLSDIARALNIEFTARGSVVRRLAVAVARKKELPHIADLVPFTSDVDITYYGAAPKETVARALRAHVPTYDLFRWQLRSSEEDEPYVAARLASARIPVAGLALSERREGFYDPFDGREDIAQNRVRFERSRVFGESPLARAHRDAEVLSAFVFASAVADVCGVEDVPSGPGFEQCEAMIDDQDPEDLGRLLARSERLRARLWYMAASTAWSTLAASGALGRMKHHLTALFDQVSVRSDAMAPDMGWTLPFELDAFSVSSRLEGDLYRTPQHQAPWSLDGDLAEYFVDALRDGPYGTDDVQLAGNQKVVAMSSAIRLEPGTAPSNSTIPAVPPSEMVHCAIRLPMDPGRERWLSDDRRLACVPIIDTAPGVPFMFQPNVVHTRMVKGNGTAGVAVRVAFGGALDRLATSEEEPHTLRLFVLQGGPPNA